MWLVKDVPDVVVHSLSYPVAATQRTGNGGDLDLQGRGRTVNNVLVAEGVFVAHSLGG